MEVEAATADPAMGAVESAAAGAPSPTPVPRKRVVQRMRRDVVVEDAQNKHAKGAWRSKGAVEHEVCVESEYSLGDARFVCFRLASGGDSGQGASAELYRRPAAEVQIAAAATPGVTSAPEREAATDVEPRQLYISLYLSIYTYILLIYN